MRALLITGFTLREAIRRRLFLAVAILSVVMVGGFTLLLNAVTHLIASTPSTTLPSQVQVLSFGIVVTLLVMWMVYVLCSALTIILSVNMISGEIEAGTFTVIVPKPLRRAEIILGKWLGHALILTVYTALMSLAFMGVISWITGYWPPHAFQAIGMVELSVLALLGLTTVCGAFVPTLANGAIAFMLFMGALAASIVQYAAQFATQVQSPAIQNTATAISLVMPTDAIWHGASFYLLPTAVLGAFQGLSLGSVNTPFTATQPVAPGLLIWVALYIVLLPVLAAWRFQHREL
jgi:ABC-type transport system involved in multi-copper enzyme maturation permease subunit